MDVKRELANRFQGRIPTRDAPINKYCTDVVPTALAGHQDILSVACRPHNDKDTSASNAMIRQARLPRAALTLSFAYTCILR